MNMKSMLGAFLALVLAVGGTAYLVARSAKAKPAAETSATPVPVNGVYRDNPFPTITEGAKPKVSVPELNYKFGTMSLGNDQSHEFIFKNEGQGPLKLAKGPLMCKCTMPEVPDQEVKPGESLAIKLTWKPEEPAEEFYKNAVIWTNDPENPRVTLSVEGKVIEDPAAAPRAFVLGDIPWDKDFESTGHLATVSYQDMEIESFESSHPEHLSATWAIEDAADFPRIEGAMETPTKSFAISVKVTPNSQVGPFNGWLKFKLKNCPATEHKIDVYGNRAGPIAIHGPDYQASMSMIDLKRFKSAEGRKTRLFMFLAPFGEKLKITEVVSKSNILTATLKKESADGAEKERYVLTIEAKPGAVVGTTYSLGTPDDLTIKTNHPKVPEILFKARYIVQ